jgi:hypothetical protein
VLASAAARAWASWDVPTPWIAPDEFVYGLTGESLYRAGRLVVLDGPTPYYSAVVPALNGIPLALGDLELGYTALKVVQALLMSLTAVPVYLWGRRLTSRRWAALAALLTLALPGLAYSGLVMSEVAFYPVVVLAAWAAAAAIATPTPARQGVFVLAAALAIATRLQAVFFVVVFPCAVALDALLGRRRLRIAVYAPAVAGVAALVVVWAGARLVVDESVLGAYGQASGTASLGRSAEFVWYHAGDLALLSGIVPLCALLVLLWSAARRGERDRHVSAYLGVCASVVVSLVLEVGVFASREVGLLAERNLIAAAPLLFLAFALWLGRGAPGGYPARAIVGLGVAAAVLSLPLGRFVVPEALPDSFSLIPVLHLRRLTSLRETEIVVWLAVVAAVLVFATLPRRLLPVLAVLLLLVLGAGSVSASREVEAQAKAQRLRLLGPSRRWIDRGADAPVAYVYDGQAYWNAVWENLFWNRRIRSVYDLPGATVPGPLPQQALQVLPDGELRPDGKASQARFAVIPVNYTLVGEQVASAPQLGTDRQGLGLWNVEPPLRLSTITTGLLPNGDVDYQAALRVYGCRSGSFDLVFLVKEPQTVRVFLDGRLARKAGFGSPTTWRLKLPVAPVARSSRICTMKVLPGGLLGTTRFAFDR